MHGKWFPVLSALKPSFRKPFFLQAHLETSMYQLGKFFRGPSGCLFSCKWCSAAAASTKAELTLHAEVLVRSRQIPSERTSGPRVLLGITLYLWVKCIGIKWLTGEIRNRRRIFYLEEYGAYTGFWDQKKRVYQKEYRAHWLEKEFFWLPDVLCIKMGFSKTRKSQRLQLGCRWKYLLIKSICFFLCVKRGPIQYVEAGNWWLQEDHPFPHLQ